jgi:hypothetical protein
LPALMPLKTKQKQLLTTFSLLFRSIFSLKHVNVEENSETNNRTKQNKKKAFERSNHQRKKKSLHACRDFKRQFWKQTFYFGPKKDLEKKREFFGETFVRKFSENIFPVFHQTCPFYVKL